MNASILLVEDHRDIAEMVFDYLQARGFSVDYAADGRAGLRLGVDNRYDAVVLDVMLPGIDGLDLCRRLRDEARLAAPVLMLTARDTRADKLAGFASGADDYLVKPFDLAEFAIREMLIVSALKREADYFWSRYAITNETPAPNTNSLLGYLFETNAAEMPAEFSNLSLGIHGLKTAVGDAVVHVSEEGGKRLYLLFDANNIQQLATYFGVAPLALMLVVLYCSAWVAYGLARKAVSPVVRLARDINVETPDLAAFASTEAASGADTEIETLCHARSHLMGRVDQLIERERNFTREASHELRSPLTVILMASDNLLGGPLDDGARGMVEKIRAAAQEHGRTDRSLAVAGARARRRFGHRSGERQAGAAPGTGPLSHDLRRQAA